MTNGAGGPRHRVAAIATDRLAMFELSIVIEIFGLDRPELGDVAWYDLTVCAAEPPPLRATGGLVVDAPGDLDEVATADTVIVPSWRDAAETPPRPLLDAVVGAHRRGARVMSVCSGVFVLAAAGLLDGRRATTHWRYAAALAARYPTITVDPGVLYVDEGDVLTSAGSSAGIDLCLHVVRRDHGAEVANEVARRLVMAPHRDGGQAQFLPEPVRPPADGDGPLDRSCRWALAHLAEPITVDDLARRVHMSPRSYARWFRRDVGTSPGRWLTHQRVLAAQRLLETTALGIDAVALGTGLGTASNLRHHFRRVVGTTPTAYRARFATTGPAAVEPVISLDAG